MRSARPVTVAILILSATLATGCHAPNVDRPAISNTQAVAPARLFARSELYFGLARRNAPNVSDAEWQVFVDAEVTPRFPAGFSILEAMGQWRGDDGAIVREPSRVLILMYERSAETEEQIEAIRKTYCDRFQQDAVLRSDSVERVRF